MHNIKNKVKFIFINKCQISWNNLTLFYALNIFFSIQLYIKEKNFIKDEVFNTLIINLYLKFISIGEFFFKFRSNYIEVSN